MSKASAEITGSVTLDLSRQPRAELGDHARLALAIETLEVTDDATYQRAGQIRLIASNRIKAVEEEFEADKRTAFQMHSSITGRIKRWTESYRTVVKAADDKMKPYYESVEAAKLSAESEIKETGEAAKEELLTQAKALRREGRIKEAKALEEEAAGIVTDVVLADATPTVEGTSSRRPWICELTNAMDLIVAIAEGRYPLMHKIIVQGKEKEVPILDFNQTVGTYYAKKLTSSMRIPGCKAKQDVQFASSRSK
jgi:hypothetical protein